MKISENREFFYGILIGLAALYLSLSLEDFKLKDLINIPAALIVFGGSLGAVLIESNLSKLFKKRGSVLNVIFCHSSGKYLTPIVERIVLWSETSRSSGILALEKHIDSVDHPLMRSALIKMVDGQNKGELQALIADYYREECSYIKETESFFHSLGGYSPTFGILGAVMGLIHVLKNMAEPSLLGSGIAVAFVATAYGVFAANMIFIPLSVRVRHQYEQLREEVELVEKGLMMVLDGVNPKLIESSLKHSYETV